jgi:hypothetical protein
MTVRAFEAIGERRELSRTAQLRYAVLLGNSR